MTKKTSFFLPPTVLLLFGAIIAVFIVLPTDALALISWWLAFLLIGLAVWPVVSVYVPLGDMGFLLAKVVGLAAVVIVSYLGSSIHVLPYQSWMLWLICLALAGFCWGSKNRRQTLLGSLKTTSTLNWIIGEEVLFLALFIFWAFMRAQKPGLDSLEKMMNIGFMQSLWRTTWLPANDMWLASHSINYYYLGHFTMTALAKMTHVIPFVSYNLGVASVFAFTFSLSFHIGQAFILTFWQNCGLKRLKPLAVFSGTVTGVLVSFGGNGHAILYSGKGLLHSFLLWLERIGIANTNSLARRAFFFSDSTRFIGHNPDLPDKTIHEFPYYSFLVADLHAHMIDLIFVLLFIALTISLLRLGIGKRTAPLNMVHDVLKNPLLWTFGILMSLMMMTNFWDFAIYTVPLAFLLWIAAVSPIKTFPVANTLSIGVLLLQMMLLLGPFVLLTNPLLALGCYLGAVVLNIGIVMYLKTALTYAGAALTFVFSLAHAFALPFNLSFEPISKTILRVPSHSAFYQLVVLWAVMVLVALIVVLRPICYAITKKMHTNKPLKASLPTHHLWLLVFFGAALLMLIIPEIVYVKDIYGLTHARANTMFKFTYQAFVMLMIIWGVGLSSTIIAHRLQKQKIWIAATILALLCIVPLTYPVVATKDWLGEVSPKNVKSLDGTKTMRPRVSPVLGDTKPTAMADNFALIDWINDNIKGQPIILETTGPSYTEYCLVSAFTGCPTVLGWNAHEWLWRTSTKVKNAHSELILPISADISSIYQARTVEVLKPLLAKYKIEYIVVSEFERKANPALREDILKQVASPVFSQNTATLYKVNTSD